MRINGFLSCSLIAVLVSSGILYGMSLSEFGFFQYNSSFAQGSNTPIGNSGSGLETTTTPPPPPPTAAAAAAVQFNTYENNELGLSLKYPSTFLIDESNLNQTLRQASFFPVDNISAYPEKHIQWMDVFVQPLNASQSALSAPLLNTTTTQSDNAGIRAFMENLANDILQQNEDVTILNSSADALLS